MASNYTEHYDLCQWEPTDAVQRVEFNQDNAKLDAALAELETAKQRLDRAAANLAYYTGRLTAREMLEQQRHPSQRGIHCDLFLSSTGRTFTGGVSLQNNTLVLSGANQTGSMTTISSSITKSGWTQARLWVHHSGGDVAVKLNGEPMEHVWVGYEPSIPGERCLEQEFVWNGQGKNFSQVTLELSTGNSSSMTVYDFFVLFF
mgnify:FL=1